MEAILTPKFKNENRVMLLPIFKHKADYVLAKSGKTATMKIILKAFIIVVTAILNYCLIVFGGFGFVVNNILFALLGLNFAAIGFNIMHDAGHGNYSKNQKWNDVLVLSLNLVGGNAFLWKFKHNILHHTYTNLIGNDEDIEIPFMRVHKWQKLKKYHRYQHIYCFFLYTTTYFLWIWVADFVKYFTGKINKHEAPKKSLKEHLVFWLSKAFYVFYMVYIPIQHLGIQEFLIGYAILCATCGLFISVIFQLAHIVEGTENPSVNEKNEVENEWVKHEIETTANFATKNKFVTWFSGGLNFQIEHHIYPKINHAHYPALQPFVQEICVEYGINYNESPTFFSAIASHTRCLKKLGTEE